MPDSERLKLVESLSKKHPVIAADKIRRFFNPSSTKPNEILYYIVPIMTTTMGRIKAHVDANTGQVIAFKGRHHNYHVAKTKRGTLDPNVIAIVDKWLMNFFTTTMETNNV